MKYKIRLDLTIEDEFGFADEKEQERWFKNFFTAKNLRLEDREYCEELKIVRINKKSISGAVKE